MGTTTKEIGSSSFNDMISSVDRRSEYVENRAGANVRLNNFLTPYTLDDKSSILNAPCGYSNGVYASLRPVATYGAELVTNGGFDTDTDWTKQSGWSISNGVASALNSSSFIYQAANIQVNKTYLFSFQLVSINSGGVKAVLNGTPDTNSPLITQEGFYTFRLKTSNSNGNISILGSNGFTGSIDNVSIKESIEADFDFTRGSAATRVTKDGLIKNVQILSGELVQNGNFEQIGSEEITNGDFSQIGSELVTNGDFATDSDWILENGAVINNGSVNIIGVGSRFRQDVLTVGKLYKLQYEVISTNGELFRFQDGITAFSDINQTIGSHTYYFKATGVRVQFQAVGDVDARIDNVSVKEVGQDWSFSSQSEFTSEGARVYSSDGSYQYIVQNNILTIGKQYKVTFDVVSTNGASLASGTGAFIYDTSTTGSKTFYLKADDAGFMLKRLSGVTDVTVTNISVKEVGQNWTFVGNANIIDGAVSYIDDGTNTNSYCSQSGILTSGKKYKVSFDVIRYVSGLITVETGSIATNVDISNGIGTYIIEAETNNTFVALKRNGSSPNFDFDISNVSVIEITDDTDLPRIDYTNGTGSLLLEPQSTNTATYSNDFTQGDLFNSSANPSLSFSVLTQNQETAPDGTNNGWLLKDNNDGGTGFAGLNYFSTQVNSDDFNTISIFAKKALSNDFLILESSGYDVSATGRSYFNISNGSLGNISTAHTAKIEDYGNGWYRCSITFQTTTDLQGAIYVRLASSNGVVNITRDGTNGVYLFGLQCEADATQNYATSYIPTSGSTVTRNADLCNNAGSSDLINSTEGVLYFELKALTNGGSYRALGLSNSNNSNAVNLLYRIQSNQIWMQVRTNNVETNIVLYDVNQSQNNKIALSYKENDFRLWVNGIEKGTNNNGLPPIGLETLKFSRGGGGEPFYGNVRSVAVFKEALTDEELAKITSTTQQEVFYEMRDKMLQINADYYEFGDYTTRLKKLF